MVVPTIGLHQLCATLCHTHVLLCLQCLKCVTHTLTYTPVLSPCSSSTGGIVVVFNGEVPQPGPMQSDGPSQAKSDLESVQARQTKQQLQTKRWVKVDGIVLERCVAHTWCGRDGWWRCSHSVHFSHTFHSAVGTCWVALQQQRRLYDAHMHSLQVGHSAVNIELNCCTMSYPVSD